MAMADLSIGGEKDVPLIALTSHFAQVQFRLKQITSSPADKREGLLRQLEEFAFQGCPVNLSYDSNDEQVVSNDGSNKNEQDQLQRLLCALQAQLAELTGAPPTSPSSFDKQSVVLDELRKRFDVQFEDLDSLSEDEVRIRINEAISKKQKATHKDTIVRQLISQVRSMEEHITQLQSELATVTSSPTPLTPSNQTTVLQHYDTRWGQEEDDDCLMSLHQASSEESLVTSAVPISTKRRNLKTKTSSAAGNDKGIDSLQRTLALMQILTLWGCGGRFDFSSSTKTPNVINEYPRAVRTLELAVDKILLISTALNEPGIQPATSVQLESELFEAVSMNLSDSLQELIEHGWTGLTTPTSCMPPIPSVRMGGAKNDMNSEDCNAWKTIKYYYHLKKGPTVCDKPDMKLSSSFCLPIDSSLKPKQTLLSSVYQTDKCFASCRHYKHDVKFRSLVCEGFNIRHLHEWIRLVVNHPSLVDDLYKPSSFVAITKFRPVLQILDRLSTAPKVSYVTLPSSYYHHVN